ncbi:MAG: hypothetical protein ACI308_08165 [Muribaculaceae bacterium]
MNDKSAFSAEQMALIDAICGKGNTPQERDRVKNLVIQLIQSETLTFNIDYYDIVIMFENGGRLMTFESECDASLKKRSELILSDLKRQVEGQGPFNKMIIYVETTEEHSVLISEMNQLSNLFGEECDSLYAINIKQPGATTATFRVVLLVQ